MSRKDVGLNLRIERELRDEFLEVCRREGESAAAVIRRFMRQYVANRATPAQQDLFEQLDQGPRERRGPVRSVGKPSLGARSDSKTG